MVMMMKCWLALLILLPEARAGGTRGTSRYPGKTSLRATGRVVGAPLRRSDSLPTLHELQERLERGHRLNAAASRTKGKRNLIYNGQPTGGSKYPFLVSVWLGTSTDVRNTTLLTPNLCHGVMITDDVFVTHRACAAALAVFPIVMVGDYDVSKPLEESVQLREVTYVVTSLEHIYSGNYDDEVTLDPSNLAVGVLAEPVNFPGFVPAVMNDDPTNPQPDQALTVVGYGTDMEPLGLNLTEWPGPALEATMSAMDGGMCWLYSTWFFGVPIFVDAALLCAKAVVPDEARPCQDDLGGPVLDSDNKLLGFTYLTNCAFLPVTLFLKTTYFQREVHAAACQLSTSDSLSFPCTDWACPADTVLPGYPWVELVDVRPYAKARNGFDPVEVTQIPPPGSILRYDTARTVTVTATDAANRSLSCQTTVVAPQLLACGTVEFNVPAGTYGRTGVFQPNRTIVSGNVFKMRGILQSRLSGKGSVIARLRKGSDKYTGSIVFQGNRTKGAINNLFINSPFSFLNASDSLVVDLDVKNVTNPLENVARYVVYCQEVFAAFS